MKRRAGTAAWLLFVWVALTGVGGAGHLALGAVAALGRLWRFRPVRDTATKASFRLGAALLFAGFFVVKFLHANVQVALAVFSPTRARYRPAIVAVPIAAPSELTTLVLADAVSLTPGTSLVEIRHDPPRFYVHVLHFRGLRTERLDILDLEYRIVKAFGPADATRRVTAIIASIEAGDQMEAL